jgi:deoxyadenosine/deoxycytidine kinase
MKIVIDGNIASGKSTQLAILEKNGFSVQYEPIEKWPLDLYYSDPVRWGFLFQIMILQTLEVKPGFTIYERSPISSRDVFWKAMEKTDIEDQVYREEFRRYAWLPDVYIYIQKDPDLCYAHLNTRNGQNGDSGVTLEYLKTLDANYKTMYESSIPCDKYIVDGNMSVSEIYAEIFRIVKLYV